MEMSDAFSRSPTPHDWNNLVLESIQEAQFAVDTSWQIVYINRHASTVFQQPSDSLIGHMLWEMFPELAGSELEQFYRAAMGTEQTSHRQHFSQKLQRWYDIRACPNAYGLVIAFHDITDYKDLEAAQHLQAQRRHALAASDEVQLFAEHQPNHQRILDNLAHQMYETFGDMCTITTISDDGEHLGLLASAGPDPAVVALLRLRHEQRAIRVDESPFVEQIVREATPVLLAHLTPTQAAAFVLSELQSTALEKPFHSAIILPMRARGRAIGVFGLLRMDPELPGFTEDDLAFVQLLANRVALMITYARLLRDMQDELERRTEAETALRNSEARYQGIIASAMDAIISINAELRIIVFNTAAEQMFQYSAADVFGRPLDALLPHSIQAYHAEYIRQFRQTGVTNRSMRSPGVLTARRKNGEEFPIEATISQTAVGGVPIYTVIIRDVSQRKQLERQLAQAQKMESIGRLAGGIAHDFNNLLTAILSYSEMIAESLPHTHPNYTNIQEIQRASGRASALTRQLLAFSRQQMLAPKHIDVNETVQDIEKLLRRTIGDDIRLVTVYAPQPLVISADPHQMGQVLLNLAINARDAMPEGGQLTIETAAIEVDASDQLIHHGEITPGWYVVLTITDTGIGMDLSTQSQIFEPFFTTKEQGKGTGLGLATVYGIVRQSNGSIRVSSDVGVGSTFKIYIPLVSGETKLVPVEQPAPSHGERQESLDIPVPRLRILVVEDDNIVREILIRALTNAGYTLLFAENGQEALALLEGQDEWPAVVLTDMVMPVMGGQQLIPILREAQPSIKIIGMSGYIDIEKTSRSIREHCDAFLQKPFTAKMLLREVREVLANTPA